MKASWKASRGVHAFRLVNSAALKTLNCVVMSKVRFVIIKPLGANFGCSLCCISGLAFV
jgi:hypothetical protein